MSDYIEQLSSIDPTKFGVSITSIDGQKFNIGDADELFCLQSTVMPVTYACALDESGPEKVHNHVGKEPSGRSFNEICLKQIPETERVVPERTAIPHNPLINAGALVCTSLIRPKESLASRLKYYLDVWSDLCGKPVSFDPTVMMAERAHADRNYALVRPPCPGRAYRHKWQLHFNMVMHPICFFNSFQMCKQRGILQL